MDPWIHFPDHVLTAWRSEFYYDDHSIAGKRPDLDASSIFRVVPVRDRLPPVARISALGSRLGDAVYGSRFCHKFLPAHRPRCEWRAGFDQRWWQPSFMAALVLVSRASRSVCPDSARI